MIAGIRDLAPRFDDFLVDIWGVVHDGGRPYDGVLDALERLHAAEKRVLFVTNTSRAAAAVIDILVGTMGVDRGLFLDVVSSGDVTRDALAELPPGMRCFHHGDPSFVPWLFELPFVFTEDVAEAELVVASGAPRTETNLDAARTLLAPAAARRVRLVCTNPDEVIPDRAGATTIGPGAVARVYAELGGPVTLYGKPYAPIYAEARRKLGDDAKRRMVAIGDLPETDIRGARTAGIPSVLVTRGRPVPSTPADSAPDMVVDRFVW
jgi:HAD superfamily hydrolase (TIGR01459 family)